MLTDSIGVAPLLSAEDKIPDGIEKNDPEGGIDDGAAVDNPKDGDYSTCDESLILDEEWLNQWRQQTFLLQAVLPGDNQNRTLGSIMPEPGGISGIDQKSPFFAVLDSGASYSVVGIPWVSRWCDTMSSAGRDL